MTLLARSSGEYWIVIDTARDRIVAQGRKTMCELIAAGRPIFAPQGSLLE